MSKSLWLRTFAACWLILPRPAEASVTTPCSKLEPRHVVEAVLRQNASVEAARTRTEISTVNAHAGMAGFWPTLSWQGKATAGYLLHPRREFSSPSAESCVQLYWNVSNLLRHRPTYKRLAGAVRVATCEQQKTVDEQIGLALTTYYDLVLAQLHHRILKKGLQRLQKAVAIQETKEQLGSGVALDTIAVKARCRKLEEDILGQQERIEKTRHVLCRLMGEPFSKDFSTPEDIPVDPSSLVVESLPSAESAVSYRLVQTQYDQACLELQQKKWNQWPDVGLWAQYSLNGSRNGGSWSNDTGKLTYGISLSANLFNAWVDTTAVREAQLRARNARLALEAQRLETGSRIQQQWAHHTYQLQHYAMMQQHLEDTQKQLDAAWAQYDLGTIDLLTLHKAQQAADETAMKYAQVCRNMHVADVALRQTLGTLEGAFA